jgi:hypothetical protein
MIHEPGQYESPEIIERSRGAKVMTGYGSGLGLITILIVDLNRMSVVN